MSEERFEFYSDDYLIGVLDTVTGKTLNHFATIDVLNEQQKFIDLLFNELLNAQKQGYVLNCTHQMERCSLIPKEIEDE